MNRDETANIIKAMFHQFIAQNRYYFNVHTDIGQQMNKRSLEDWKLCRHNHWQYGNAVSSISDIVEMKEMDDILINNYIKALGMTQMFTFYLPVFISVWLIGVMMNLIFCQETSAFYQLKRNGQKIELWKKGFKMFTETGLVPSYIASKVLHVLMTVFIHLHCPMLTSAPISVNTYTLNLVKETCW